MFDNKNNNLYGVDPSNKYINIIRQVFPNGNFKVGDASIIKEYSDNLFDIILIHSSVQYFDNLTYFNNIMQLCYEKLKPNGKLVGLWFPLDKHIDEGGPPYGTSVNEVKAIFNNGWEIVKEEFSEHSIKPRKEREKLIIFKKLTNID